MGYDYEVLQRIAEFSARIRGHQLANWQVSIDSCTATCSTCGRAVTIYPSFIQPEVDGEAIEFNCREKRGIEAA